MLQKILEKTDRVCHLCGSRLAYSNYAKYGSRGAWEVDHGVAWARGGSDHLNNLWPACIPCNRSKWVHSARSVRARNGLTRSPMSRAWKDRRLLQNVLAGSVIGGCIGGILKGREGFFAGAAAGAFTGAAISA